MDSFKLRVVLGEVQIELEGNENMVQSIFSQICENGLSIFQPSKRQNISIPIESNTSEVINPENAENQEFDASSQIVSDYPSLANVILKGNLKTEAEWILLYAFYSSAFGAQLFSEDDLRLKYDETKRFNEARRKNFKTNIKSLATKGYISAINAAQYRIERDGIEKAKSILLNGQDTFNVKQKTKKTTSKKQPPKYEKKQLSISEPDIKDMRDFWNRHDHSSHMDKAVLIAYWLKENKDVLSINVDYVFTILRTLGENASFDLLSALKNAKNKRSYFDAGLRATTSRSIILVKIMLENLK